jgi:hypothetical protein
MLPDKIEHCIVFMDYWDVSGVFWSFSKCKIKIPHLPADPSSRVSQSHTQCRRAVPVAVYGVLDLEPLRLMLDLSRLPSHVS